METQQTPASARDVKWHFLESDTVLGELGTRDDGLSAEEAENRYESVGPNVLERSSGDGVLGLLWRQINDPLIYVLLASSALAMALGKIVDGSVVLGVVVINTLIGFAQEYKAGKDIEALTDLVPNETTVLRDGERTVVEAPKIVPGDVILLESGDKVPADGRLLAQRNLQIDEAALTGESVPVYKGTDSVSEDASIGERTGMVYGGTLVTSGTGRAAITATANETELGRISEMLSETTEVQTPLTRQISTAGKWITGAILVVAVLLFRRRPPARLPAGRRGAFGHRPRRRRHPRRTAGGHHHRARQRGAPHGRAPGRYPLAARDGDAGQRDRDLHGQNRHPYQKRDDRKEALDAGRLRKRRRKRRILRTLRRRLRARGCAVRYER